MLPRARDHLEAAVNLAAVALVVLPAGPTDKSNNHEKGTQDGQEDNAKSSGTGGHNRGRTGRVFHPMPPMRKPGKLRPRS
jgi:hypothetical protein